MVVNLPAIAVVNYWVEEHTPRRGAKRGTLTRSPLKEDPPSDPGAVQR